MLEKLYEPLPNRDLYWQRLRMKAPTGPKDKALLDEIIYAHQCSIPFENLDIFEKQLNVSLGIGDLFKKIICSARGGYCFELNALFHALLTEIGYEVTPCVGRSLKDRGYIYPFTHRALIVSLDGQKLFCDVGYGGPMPPCSIPLIDGYEVSSHGQTFKIQRDKGSWWKLFYLGNTQELEDARATGKPERTPVPVVAFLDEPMELTDFVVLSHFCATSPLSVFTQWRMVNLRTPDGNKSITANAFTRVSKQKSETLQIEDDAQLHQLLKDEFGIIL